MYYRNIIVCIIEIFKIAQSIKDNTMIQFQIRPVEAMLPLKTEINYFYLKKVQIILIK